MHQVLKGNAITRMLRGTIGAALLFAVIQFTALTASAQQFIYHGRDATYPNINMELRITRTAGPWDATGSIYVGSYTYLVKGTLSGNSMVATAVSVGSRALYRTGVNGTLSGALGSGTLTVTTGPMVFNGPGLNLRFVLTPAGAPGPVAANPAPTVATSLPQTLHLTGGTGFGYTRVTLTLDLVLRGSSYQVNGTLFVNQIQPVVVQRTLQISGTLTPGVQGALAVSGASPGDTPNFTATLGQRGAPLQGLITGIPSLSITRLYVGAQ